MEKKETRNAIEYKTANGKEKTIGKFGQSTQKEFDEALKSLPALIKRARAGSVNCGHTANALLWHLANESMSTRETMDFECYHRFGRYEV